MFCQPQEQQEQKQSANFFFWKIFYFLFFICIYCWFFLCIIFLFIYWQRNIKQNPNTIHYSFTSKHRTLTQYNTTTKTQTKQGKAYNLITFSQMTHSKHTAKRWCKDTNTNAQSKNTNLGMWLWVVIDAWRSIILFTFHHPNPFNSCITIPPSIVSSGFWKGSSGRNQDWLKNVWVTINC